MRYHRSRTLGGMGSVSEETGIGHPLSATLKELIRHGLVTRRQYDEIPPRVEYALTDKGSSVVPILQSICQWAGIFQRESSGRLMTQCQKCDYSKKKKE